MYQRSPALWALTFAGLTSSSSSFAAVRPMTNLSYVSYQGVQNETYKYVGKVLVYNAANSSSVDAYYGIRYAAAPTGVLRWQPPVPIEQRNNYIPGQIIDAGTPGPECIQGVPAWQPSIAGPSAPGSEDCLLLNVLVPHSAKTPPSLPVILNIHGGGEISPI